MSQPIDQAVDEPTLAHQLQEARAAEAALATIDASKSDNVTAPQEQASKPAVVAAVEDSTAPAAVAADPANVEATEHVVATEESKDAPAQPQQQQHSTGLLAGVKRQLANLKKDTHAPAEGDSTAAVKSAEDKKDGGLAGNLRRKLAAGFQARDTAKAGTATTTETTESQAIAAATPLPPSVPDTPPIAPRKEEAPPVSVDTSAHPTAAAAQEEKSTPRDILAKFRRRISGGVSGASSPTATPTSETATPAAPVPETPKPVLLAPDQSALVASPDPIIATTNPDVQSAASAPAVVQSSESKSEPVTPAPVGAAEEPSTTSSTPGGAGAAEKRKSMRASLAQSWRKFSDKDVRTTSGPTTPDAAPKSEERGFSLPFKRRRSASPPAAVKEAKTSPTEEIEEPVEQSQATPATSAAEDKQPEPAPATTTEQSSTSSGGGGALLNLIAGIRSKVTPLLSKDKASTDAAAAPRAAAADESGEPAQPRRSFSVSDVKDRLFGGAQKQRPKSMHGGGASESAPAAGGEASTPAPALEPIERVADIKASLVHKTVDEGDSAKEILRSRAESHADTVKPDEATSAALASQASLPGTSAPAAPEAAEPEAAVDAAIAHKDAKTAGLVSASSHSIDTQAAVTAHEAPSTAASSPTLASPALPQ